MIVILLTWSPKRSLHYTLLNFKGVIQSGGHPERVRRGWYPKKLKSFYSYVLHPTNYQTNNMTTLEITEQDKLVCCDCLSPEEEDTCECCGKPYDDRSNHYLWELCDCVQNDDGTLSRPEEEDDEVSVCYECGECLDDPSTHIFCFEKEGEKDRTLCCECGQDFHKEYKSEGWTRDDEE